MIENMSSNGFEKAAHCRMKARRVDTEEPMRSGMEREREATELRKHVFPRFLNPPPMPLGEFHCINSLGRRGRTCP